MDRLSRETHREVRVVYFKALDANARLVKMHVEAGTPNEIRLALKNLKQSYKDD
jgi:hypothetical protein